MAEFMGKKLNNPIIASSCIATENTQNILRLVRNGVQGVILKSCADYVRTESNDKRQFAVDKKTKFTFASSPFQKEILTLNESLDIIRNIRTETDVLLIPSFTASGLNPDDWLSACRQLESAGADGIQLDFFYMGSIIGMDGLSDKITGLLQNLVSQINIPVMPKLNINFPKDFIIPLLVKSGIEYVSLLDSIHSPYLEMSDGKYHISKRLDTNTTSCFGNWQLPLTLSYTYTASEYGLKVCAGGGVTCSDDVRKLIATGADTVQSATFLTKFPEKLYQLFPDCPD